MSSSVPFQESSSPLAETGTDPVVDIIESAGLVAGRGVHDCSELAAAAHHQRYARRRADSSEVNRSTYLWALWQRDETVRTALEGGGGSLEKFEEELGISGEPGPLTGPIELSGELTRALQVAVRVLAAEPRKFQLEVSPTALGAAILEDLDHPGGLLAGRLRGLGIDVGAVLAVLRPPAVPPEIDGDLDPATRRGGGEQRATFATDSATAARINEATDDLGIRADVDMLAKLIASKDVHPPLSIGLFGPWGSGKSYLMRQVQLRIRDLALRSRAPADGVESGYVTDVVPVEFNAWQYAHGTGLWASLITRVFEGIKETLVGDERYHDVLRQLADKEVGVAQARERLDVARTKVDQSRSASEDRLIQNVVTDHKLDAETSELKAILDPTNESTTVGELRTTSAELDTFVSRLRQGWSAAAWTWKAAVVALSIAAAVGVVVGLLWPGALQWTLAVVSGIAAFFGAAQGVIGPVAKGLKQAEKVLGANDKDKKERDRAEADLARATKELGEAKTSGLAGLYDFVSGRSIATEYREHLGMAPVIRDDLERLTKVARKSKDHPGIDRIVIFIDDLDRCPAAEVVRILEAVNLLFGFELFVVVVAVDSRWLVRSLENSFSEAFEADAGSGSEAPTPQNYLEKIIQIPFWLQPMQREGFGRLVTSLAGEVDSPPANGGGPGGGNGPGHGNGNGSGDSLEKVPVGKRVGRDGGGSTTTHGTGTPDQGSSPSGPDESELSRVDDLNPEALRLTQDERDVMMTFLRLVDTPRAVKRFLNTYQLLRVSVVDVDAFLAAEDYKPVLLLLALVTGTAPITEPMLDELRRMTEHDFATFLGRTQAGRTASNQAETDVWAPIARACDGLPTDTLTPDVIAAWLPKVARYSFHPVSLDR